MAAKRKLGRSEREDEEVVFHMIGVRAFPATQPEKDGIPASVSGALAGFVSNPDGNEDATMD